MSNTSGGAPGNGAANATPTPTNGAAHPNGPQGRSTGVSAARIASWGPWGEPFFGIGFGEAGVGKSMDLSRLVAGNWKALTQEGGVKPAWGELGVDLMRYGQRQTVHTLEEATAIAYAIGSMPDCGGWAGLGIDDVSLLCMNTFRAIKRNPPLSKKGAVDDFEIWDMVADRLHMFATVCRWAGLHVWCNGHTRGPTTDPKSGEFIKGGPATPSAKLTRTLCYYADTLFRVGTEAGRFPWPGVYECTDDASYAMKDRHGLRGRMPMNAAELMRAVGYVIAYPKGSEWIGAVAEEIAVKLLAGEDAATILPAAAHTLFHRHGFDPRHIQWAVYQDGQDRAIIRRMMQTRRLAALGIGLTSEAGPGKMGGAFAPLIGASASPAGAAPGGALALG